MTDGSKPYTPTWAGIGDFDVVWDWQNSRWFMVASKMRAAISYDKSASAESWSRLNGSLTDTEGKNLPNGEHPTIHWNRF